MAIQPEPILRAAARWLERIPRDGTSRTRSLLVTNPRLADLTPTQYETALAWLERTGLLSTLPSDVPAAVRVFESAVSEAGWFPDADALVRHPDELPQDALEAATALGFNDQEAFQHLQAIWGKVDTEQRELVGAAGEANFVALLRASVVADVDHVSQWSDGLGYDVAVSAPGFVRHLEVKSSTRQGRLSFYLSRNEFNVLCRDPDWTLVAIALSIDLSVVGVSTVPSSWIAHAAPKDLGAGGRWESCKFDVPADVVTPGLAALAPVLSESASPLLSHPG